LQLRLAFDKAVTMRDKNLWNGLLGLQRPWVVREVELATEEREVRVWVEHASTALKCPDCGRRCTGYDTRQRRWRHLDTMQYKTIVIADVPRANCDTHGIHQVSVPWAESGGRFTALFEALIIDWLHEASTLCMGSG